MRDDADDPSAKGRQDRLLEAAFWSVGNDPPDIAALRSSATRIVVGVGEASATDQLAARSTRALAERLGVEPVPFPGSHGGFGRHDAFATLLVDVLSATE